MERAAKTSMEVFWEFDLPPRVHVGVDRELLPDGLVLELRRLEVQDGPQAGESAPAQSASFAYVGQTEDETQFAVFGSNIHTSDSEEIVGAVDIFTSANRHDLEDADVDPDKPNAMNGIPHGKFGTNGRIVMDTTLLDMPRAIREGVAETVMTMLVCKEHHLARDREREHEQDRGVGR